jgi:hypothetical protein
MVCAQADVTTERVTTPDIDAPISNASPVRMRGIAKRSPSLSFGFLFNTSSCQALRHFTVVSAKGDIGFP